MKALATVKVTVEVPLSQPWGEDCTVGQVLKQAKDSARQKLAKALQKTGIRMVNDATVQVSMSDSGEA